VIHTDDKELLEKAAKAAGYSTEPYFDGTHIGANKYEYTEGPNAWNPLTDDGDALRLAVKLDMFWENLELFDMYFDAYDKDKTEATRRAIVRAAAAIGEGMT